MKVTAIKTAIYTPSQSLIEFITRHIPKIPNKSVLVVTSKIVSVAEGRIGDVLNKESLIKAESDIAIKGKYAWICVKGNDVMASAGIDESNAGDKILLLPKDSFLSATKLRKHLMKFYKLKEFGVLITDSRSLPFRSGISGVALGYAGIKGKRNYRGKKDLFGRELHFSQTNVADSIAAAAVLTMGEGNEQRPLAIIENAPVEFIERITRSELRIHPKDDLYAPLYEYLNSHD
ncbi:MAG: coenzyme F420-0:L-glutamate ligase [Candidatus Komeilibacteria bacterium]|nr:coenzyme F420-0:L-glutamate ligase [Candidatus Komeilibacteria bacterium]